MSRIGKHPVPVPSGVTVAIDGQTVNVKGKLGELSFDAPPEVSLELNDAGVVVAPRDPEHGRHRAMWGMARTRVANLVHGVAEGYTKGLIIQGVGFRAAVDGSILNLQLGFSHDIKVAVPDDLKIACPTQTEITISGRDKQRVGEMAATIRGFRPPEPYKGKGVRYSDEQILRKEGKKK